MYYLKNEDFTAEEYSRAKAILVIGETGSGKTTLINSFANFICGVKISDPFRYKVILIFLKKKIIKNNIYKINK